MLPDFVQSDKNFVLEVHGKPTSVIGSFHDKISGSYLILEVSSHNLPFGGCRPHTGEFQAEALPDQYSRYSPAESPCTLCDLVEYKINLTQVKKYIHILTIHRIKGLFIWNGL